MDMIGCISHVRKLSPRETKPPAHRHRAKRVGRISHERDKQNSLLKYYCWLQQLEHGSFYKIQELQIGSLRASFGLHVCFVWPTEFNKNNFEILKYRQAMRTLVCHRMLLPHECFPFCRPTVSAWPCKHLFLTSTLGHLFISQRSREAKPPVQGHKANLW